MLDENACNLLNNKIDNLSKDIKNLDDRIDKMEKKIDLLDVRFVTVDRFRPVEMIAYGVISLVGGGVVVAILSLILVK